MCTLFRLFVLLTGVKITQYGHTYHSKENILCGLLVVAIATIWLAQSAWRYRS